MITFWEDKAAHNTCLGLVSPRRASFLREDCGLGRLCALKWSCKNGFALGRSHSTRGICILWKLRRNPIDHIVRHL